MTEDYPDAVLPILQKLSARKTGIQIFTPTDTCATPASALRFSSYLRPVEVQTASDYLFGGHLNINMLNNQETLNIVKNFLK